MKNNISMREYKALGVLVITIIFASTFSTAHALVSAVNVDASVNVGGNRVNTSADTKINTPVASSTLMLDTDVHTTETTNADAHVNTSSTEVSSAPDVDTSSDTQVVVKYKRPAKLFGFIKIYLTEEAVVKAEADGSRTVEVNKPWWSVFAKSDVKTEEFTSTLKSRMSASAHADASAHAQLSASDKAMIVSEINAAAQATYTK